MKELVNLESRGMMSSKRIAEKTGKEHKTVLRDIRNMLDSLRESEGTVLYPNEFQEVMAKNSMTAEIFMNERLSLCLASGYSIALRMMIIDDWAEIKRSQLTILPNFLDPAESAIAWANEYKAKKLAENKVLELQPKADFYDAVTESEDTIDLGTAAKVLNLGYGRTTLFSKLREARILMSKNQPYQKYIDEGLFRVIETKFAKPDGTTHIYIKTLVLQKGLDFIRRKLTG